MQFSNLFSSKKPLIGMIHLPALPGYPAHKGMAYVVEKALRDLNTLEEAGFDGVLVENDNDQPHYIDVPGEIRNAFTKVMLQIIDRAHMPVGMEIIYDMQKTLEVAHEVKAQFLRFDVFVDSVETKYGSIPAEAIKLKKLQKQLNAESILLLTDIQVKHARMITPRPIAQSAKDAMANGSDALIVTGSKTGEKPTLVDCREIKEALPRAPLLVGSGFALDNARELLSYADGAIVGTSIKAGEYIDLKKAKELVRTVKSI